MKDVNWSLYDGNVPYRYQNPVRSFCTIAPVPEQLYFIHERFVYIIYQPVLIETVKMDNRKKLRENHWLTIFIHGSERGFPYNYPFLVLTKNTYVHDVLLPN